MSSRYDFDRSSRRRGRLTLAAGAVFAVYGIFTAGCVVAAYQNEKIGIGSFRDTLDSCRDGSWVHCGAVPGAALGRGAAVLSRQVGAAIPQTGPSAGVKPTAL